MALGRLAFVLIAVLATSGKASILAQVLDICGCAGDPTLTPFDAGNPATYPPGTSGCSGPCTSGTIVLPLPPDGILRFSSFRAVGGFYVYFAPNAANTPVTLLVAGDVQIQGSSCCYEFSVQGNDGLSATPTTAGVGGRAGNGGFRGGDGAAQPINGFTVGGTGFGPGGGRGGSQGVAPGGGTFFGLPELLPLLGGSGGGGGGSFGTSTNCTGGGGGGGGGGLLIAANGTMTLSNHIVHANGGGGGAYANSGCAHYGGGGSGGAVRLVANRFVHLGNGYVRAGAGQGNGVFGTAGRVRLESIDDSAQTAFNTDNPPALRITGPGPLSNPLAPTVRITAVNGNAVPALPRGHAAAIDVVLPAPGVTGIDVATTGVPSGTTVIVTVKPRIGAVPSVSTVPLACDTLGNCNASATFNLSAGAYVIEARATFEVE
jgi:hypothetical protein